MSAFIWIDTEQALEAAVGAWMQQAFVAIDTEFERTDTYYAKPGLIQVADTRQVYLIDPLAIHDLSALAPLLASPDVVKVMHSMSEDVELLQHCAGAAPVAAFDTQIAASLLGYGPSLGYQNLVAQTLGYELDKSETRSDWLRRPLSDKQLDYAAKDAEHLIELYQVLHDKLVACERLDACMEETQALVEQHGEAQRNPELAYLRLRGGWELSLAQQQCLQQLVIWRDATARDDNVPKSWVFADAMLIAVAQQGSVDVSALKRMKGVRFKSLRLYADALTAVLDEASMESRDDFVVIDAPIKGQEMLLFKRCKKIIAEVAEDTGIAAQLLGSRRMLEALILHVARKQAGGLPREFQGWRANFVGEKLKAALLN